MPFTQTVAHGGYRLHGFGHSEGRAWHAWLLVKIYFKPIDTQPRTRPGSVPFDKYYPTRHKRLRRPKSPCSWPLCRNGNRARGPATWRNCHLETEVPERTDSTLVRMYRRARCTQGLGRVTGHHGLPHITTTHRSTQLPDKEVSVQSFRVTFPSPKSRSPEGAFTSAAWVGEHGSTWLLAKIYFKPRDTFSSEHGRSVLPFDRPIYQFDGGAHLYMLVKAQVTLRPSGVQKVPV
jgi:hypothetical protein